MMNRRTRGRRHSLACSLINLQKRRSAGREDQKKKKEERNNNRRSSDGDDGGKVSPSSSFLSQLGGELVAAAGLALLKTRSERTHALPYICSLVVSSEVSTIVCVCVEIKSSGRTHEGPDRRIVFFSQKCHKHASSYIVNA